MSRGRFQGIAGVKIDIRAIRPNDADAVVAMAAALSAHEGKAPPPFDVAAFRRHGFGARALFDGMIAETGGKAVGYALFREMFNIDNGRPGLHMMDLFVQPEHRRGGAGRALLAALAARCLAIDGGWITWQCLERNTGAMAFYQAIGGRRFACADFELAGDALGALAAGASNTRGARG